MTFSLKLHYFSLLSILTYGSYEHLHIFHHFIPDFKFFSVLHQSWQVFLFSGHVIFYCCLKILYFIFFSVFYQFTDASFFIVGPYHISTDREYAADPHIMNFFWNIFYLDICCFQTSCIISVWYCNTDFHIFPVNQSMQIKRSFPGINNWRISDLKNK